MIFYFKQLSMASLPPSTEADLGKMSIFLIQLMNEIFFRIDILIF